MVQNSFKPKQMRAFDTKVLKTIELTSIAAAKTAKDPAQTMASYFEKEYFQDLPQAAHEHHWVYQTAG